MLLNKALSLQEDVAYILHNCQNSPFLKKILNISPSILMTMSNQNNIAQFFTQALQNPEVLTKIQQNPQATEGELGINIGPHGTVGTIAPTVNKILNNQTTNNAIQQLAKNLQNVLGGTGIQQNA